MALIQQHVRAFDPTNADDAHGSNHHYAWSEAHHVEAVDTYRWLASARADARPTVVHAHRFGGECNEGCKIVTHTAIGPATITPAELDALQAVRSGSLNLEFGVDGIVLLAQEPNQWAFELLAQLRNGAASGGA